jgi:hypothetical protein
MASVNKPAPAVEVDPINGPQVSVQRAYVNPEEVFNELPITLLEQLTDLAKQKFADEIVAGHNTDSDMAGFRSALLRDLIKAQHKQLVTRVSEKMEKKAREFYKELRARGIDREQAIKMSGYRPED